MNVLGLFWKIIQLPNFMETLSVITELFRSDRTDGGQTDMAKLIVDFRNFTNAYANKN